MNLSATDWASCPGNWAYREQRKHHLLHRHSSCHYCSAPSNPDVAIVQVAEAAGTDSDRTRDGPGSAVDRAAREVNVSAAVHPGPDWLPAMATTLLARTDAEEDRATDGWDRHSVLAELDIVAGMVRKVVGHYRVGPGLPAMGARVVDDLGAEVEGQLGQRGQDAADPVVAPVETGDHLVAAAVVAREVGNYQDSGLAGLVGRETGRGRWNPVVEDDTVAASPSAADCRDGVVEPIPAGVHRTAAEAVRMVVVVVAAVDPVVAATAPDPVAEAAAAVDSGRNCSDSDADRVVEGATATTSSRLAWGLALVAGPDDRDVVVAVVPVPVLACTAGEVAYWEESSNLACHQARHPSDSARKGQVLQGAY